MSGDALPTGDLIRPEDWADFFDLLRIPSVSGDPAHAPDVRRAAEWVCAYIRRHGGEAELVETVRDPLAVGTFRAAREGAPTVLLYAHFDVQPPGPAARWSSAPFEPAVRAGWIHARGASDDKAALFALLRATAALATAGALPVNVLIVGDGEEETEGETVIDWLRSERPATDLAIVLDGLMRDRDHPAFVLGARGCAFYRLHVRTGEADVHSGLFGGVALNAAHAMMAILGAVAEVPDALRAGAPDISDAQLAAWGAAEDGAEQLRLAGGRPISRQALDDFHRRTFALPSVDVHGIEVGDARSGATIIAARATATVSMRVAPGQDVDALGRRFERLLTDACPPGAELSIECVSSLGGAMTNDDHPLVRAVAGAFAEVFGNAPVVVPMGASVPVLEPLAALGIPTVHTGFCLPDANLHAPDERFPVALLEPAVRAVRGALLRVGAAGG